MIFLRVRKIGIDVLPDGEPFISVNLEKVITDVRGHETQVIGNFDRMYKKLSDVNFLPIGTVADDGIIDPIELYTMIAQTVYIWVIQKHGGQMIGERLVIES